MEQRETLSDLCRRYGVRNITDLLEATVKEYAPQLLSKFYPKIYEAVSSYPSPKLIAMFLAATYMETARYGLDQSPISYRLLYPCHNYLVRHQMPMLFLGRDFVEAVKRTDFQDEIDWQTLNMPYEIGILVPPRGVLSHPRDGDVACIIYARLGQGIYPPVVPGFGLTAEIDENGFSIVALCPYNNDPVWYDVHLTASKRPTAKLRNLFYRSDGEMVPAFVDKIAKLDEDLEDAVDEHFIEDLGVIVFGTMLALNARPGLASPGHRKEGKRTKSQCEIWYPYVIGKDYRLPRPYQGGTHASPRMHWRRGHFTHQAYGPQRGLRKQLWLEPMLIAAGEASGVEVSM